jgi:HAD superfamily hydrolase (TIGR01549 family)
MSPEIVLRERESLRGESIVFDWGNTLVFDPFDTLAPRVAESAANIALREFEFTLDYPKFLSAWSRSNSELNFPFASHFSQEEPWIQQGLREAGVPEEIRSLFGPQILSEYRLSFKTLLENDPRRKELRETLEAFKNKGKHLAVISNDRSFTPKATLTWLGIADLFDHFLTSEEIGIEKPDPRVFEVAAERFGRPIGDIIYVGDDPIRDVQCAHKAGAKAILYVPPEKYRSSKSWRDYSLSPDKPEFTVERFSDLLKVIA